MIQNSQKDLLILTAWTEGQSLTPGIQCMNLTSPIHQQAYAALDETPGTTIDQVIDIAHEAYRAERFTPVHQRAKWLAAAAELIRAAQAELAELIIHDIGKPRRAATFEINRSADFISTCAAEACRMGGESLPLDAVPAGENRVGFTQRMPYGVVAAITPFNAPINLLVQKVAPALAMGNAVVVKPHPAGTRVALKVAEIFAKAGLPKGLLSVITGDKEAAQHLVKSPRVLAVTFTGGTIAGDALVRAAGAKKFVSELGSNAANIVLADANLDQAAQKIAAAAFEASGQQCVSAQRVIVAESVHDAFLERFVAAAEKLKVGDPYAADTDVGPMVSLANAQRVMSMAQDAVDRGGRFALAPTQKAATVSPGIIADAPKESRLWHEEVFGPLAIVTRFKDVDEALHLANDSPFGLQGAVFTDSVHSAFRFAREFDVGALWVNEASRFRLDIYPFGGSKQSGYGREGVRYALEELSQTKFVGFNWMG